MPDNDDQTTAPPADATVPKRRLDEAIEQRKAAQADADAMKQRIAELESRDKSDVERLTAQVEKLTKANEAAAAEKVAAEQRLAQAERSSLIRDAAAAAGFHDAAAATRLVDLDGIEDADAAKAAVGNLAKTSPYLVKPRESEKPTLRKVLGPDGQPDEKAQVAATEADRRRADGEQFIAEINESRRLAGMAPLPASRDGAGE